MVKHNQHWTKTHQLLQSIVLNEMKNKPVKGITVSSVCRIANINRSTFYDHYDDIMDLKDDAVEKMDQNLIQEFKQICQKHSYHFLNQQLIETFLEFIKEHGEFYKIRLRDEKHLFYTDEIYKLINDPQNKSKSLQYYLVAFDATFINITNEWAKNDYQDSVNEIAKIIMNASPQILFDAEPQILF